MTKEQRKIKRAARRARDALSRIERELWLARVAADYLNVTLGGHPSLERIDAAIKLTQVARSQIDVTTNAIARW
jgi:hypothetical protein